MLYEIKTVAVSSPEIDLPDGVQVVEVKEKTFTPPGNAVKFTLSGMVETEVKYWEVTYLARKV